jgi:hypothetical protein
MLKESKYYCPECDEGLDLPRQKSRRAFLEAIGATAALAAINGARVARAAEAKVKPAEGLVRELYATLSDEQKKTLALPFDHGGNDPTRLKTFNSAINNKRIGENYTKAQQDLCKQILMSILSGEDAYKRLSRYGAWDNSGSFEGCGATIFGNPAEGKFAWVFSGHHVTFRCDGDSQPQAAFGGPIYYGHSENGDTKDNVYYYQTEAVTAVFDALDEKQREVALATKNPGDGLSGTKALSPRHGIAYKDLTSDQKQLVETVMRTVLGPFRKEDVDEVMGIVKAGGGMDFVNIAFYRDGNMNDSKRWHFWRLEGPGFVWNYRVLPHVHCFVNIQSA